MKNTKKNPLSSKQINWTGRREDKDSRKGKERSAGPLIRGREGRGGYNSDKSIRVSRSRERVEEGNKRVGGKYKGRGGKEKSIQRAQERGVKKAMHIKWSRERSQT